MSDTKTNETKAEVSASLGTEASPVAIPVPQTLEVLGTSPVSFAKSGAGSASALRSACSLYSASSSKVAASKVGKEEKVDSILRTETGRVIAKSISSGFSLSVIKSVTQELEAAAVNGWDGF